MVPAVAAAVDEPVRKDETPVFSSVAVVAPKSVTVIVTARTSNESSAEYSVVELPREIRNERLIRGFPDA